MNISTPGGTGRGKLLGHRTYKKAEGFELRESGLNDHSSGERRKLELRMIPILFFGLIQE